VIASAAYCLWLVIKKDSTIIAFATAHYLILMIAGFADLWADAALRQVIHELPVDPSVAKNAARGVLLACIWIPYFRFSKRVRNTFASPSARVPIVESASRSTTGVER